MENITKKYLKDNLNNKDQHIDGLVGKYLNVDEKTMNESSQNLSMVSYIRSKFTNVQYPSEIVILGSLLSLVGISMISSNDNLKNSIISMSRSLIGRM